MRKDAKETGQGIGNGEERREAEGEGSGLRWLAREGAGGIETERVQTEGKS